MTPGYVGVVEGDHWNTFCGHTHDTAEHAIACVQKQYIAPTATVRLDHFAVCRQSEQYEIVEYLQDQLRNLMQKNPCDALYASTQFQDKGVW